MFLASRWPSQVWPAAALRRREQTATPAATAAGEPDRTVLPIAEPKPPTYKELDARNAKPPARFEVKAPARRAERRDRADRRRRLRRAEHVRRSHPHADDGPARAGRPALQQLPHDGAVLADAQRAQDRTEPSHRQHRLDHGDRDGLPRQHRAESEQRRAAGGDAAAQRLQHRRLRQVARNRRLGNQRVGPVRSLAHAPGLRQVLRLHRRRNRPVVSAHLRRLDQGRSAEDAELPLHRGHDQPGDQLGEGAAVDDAGQAVLRLLRDRRDACAAPRAEGMGRQVQGPVRQGLGRRSAPKRSSARRSWAWFRPTRSWPTRPKDIKAWDSLPADQRRLFARQAEVFSGFLEQTDSGDRPVREGDRGHRRDGQHAVHLHRRRQRHQRRGRLRRHVQRDDLFQRRDREGRGPRSR